MTTRWRVGLVGAGTMGRRHALVVAAHPACTVDVIVDHSLDRAGQLAHEVGDVASFGTDGEALRGCDLVLVATSTAGHHAVAAPLVDAGVPVLVEKPLVATAAELDHLLRAARRSAAPLACGFVQRHHPAVASARRVLEEMGEPVASWHATRTSPPVPRAQGSAVLDLMVHDIDLLDRWRPFDETTHLEVEHTGLRAQAVGHVGGIDLRLLAHRDAAAAVRRLDVRTESAHVGVDLLAGTVDVRTSSGTTSVAVDPGIDPLAAQWQWFLDLVDGHHDAEAELAALERVHRLAFRIDGAAAVVA